MSSSYDLCIVGGGLVGASLAVALAPLKLRVALIESSPPETNAPARWDERCIGLNAASQLIFESLGVWPLLAPVAAPIASTHISERGRFGVARFTAQEAGLDALGYNTPLRAINAALTQRVSEVGGTEVFAPVRLLSLDTSATDTVTLTLHTPQGEREITTRLVVAADGARSTVRELLGIAAQTRDYEQCAIVSAVRPQRAHGGVAYERFLPTGPLAVLPKPDDAQGHACSLVWTIPTPRKDEMLAWSDGYFLAQAHEAFGERLGRFLALGRRGAYPLHRVMSERLSAPRVVFVGNAAQSLHPVAAQGFNLGLRDVAALSEVLAQSSDPGAAETLSAYEALREKDRQRTAGFTDGLVRVFSNSVPGLRGLRHLGLLALDLATPAKDAVMRQNLGLGGRVPKLARV